MNIALCNNSDQKRVKSCFNDLICKSENNQAMFPKAKFTIYFHAEKSGCPVSGIQKFIQTKICMSDGRALRLSSNLCNPLEELTSVSSTIAKAEEGQPNPKGF